MYMSGDVSTWLCRLVAREDGSQRVCIAGLTETEVPDVDTLIRVSHHFFHFWFTVFVVVVFA